MNVGMSLGISPREPISHTVQVVQNAERLGFDSVWIADCQMSMKDCYIALALCAVNTSYHHAFHRCHQPRDAAPHDTGQRLHRIERSQ